MSSEGRSPAGMWVLAVVIVLAIVCFLYVIGSGGVGVGTHGKIGG